MDQVTHFLFLAAMILVIMYTLMWLSGASCIWGFKRTDPISRLQTKIDDFIDVEIAKACIPAYEPTSKAGKLLASWCPTYCKVDAGQTTGTCPPGMSIDGDGKTTNCTQYQVCKANPATPKPNRRY